MSVPSGPKTVGLVDFRKRRPAQTSTLARFRRFPKIEMELLFSRPPGEAAGWRKNFLALFDASSEVGASGDERNPPRARSSQTASMKLTLKSIKRAKPVPFRVELERFSAVGKGYVAILTVVSEKPIFRVLRPTNERGAPSRPDLGRGRRFFRFLNRSFSRAALSRLMKFWRIDGNSRTNKIVRQRVTAAPKERFGRFSAVETVETARVEKNGERRFASPREKSGVEKRFVAAPINILMAKRRKKPSKQRRRGGSSTFETSVADQERSDEESVALNFNGCSGKRGFGVKRSGEKRRKKRVFRVRNGF